MLLQQPNHSLEKLLTGCSSNAPSPRSLSSRGLRWVLATSLVAAWIELVNNKSTTQTTHSGNLLIDSHARRTLLRPASLTVKPTSTRRLHIVRRHNSTKSTASDTKQHRMPDSGSSVHASHDHGTAAELTNARDINALMKHPLLPDHVKAPRHPIVLCHGLYGFDVRGPFWGLEIHYWANVLDILRKKIGVDVIVRGVPGTGAIADRARALHTYLTSPDAGIRGAPLNFVGHSMGGLDARYLISVIKPAPEEYIPISLTTVNTPHRGSPFMDWCNANVGTGNERVEAELREARERQRSSHEHTASVLHKDQKDGEPYKGEEATKFVVSKPPFSLKSPLFVRPSKAEAEARDSKSKEDSVRDVTSKIVQAAASPSSGDTAKAKKSSTASLLNFTTFTRALSSIGGSFSSYMLSVLDQPAYAMLSTRYMAYVFNPAVQDSPNVSYFSVASRKRSLPIYHPLWLPKLILDAAAESRSAGGERDGSADALGSRLQGNDGLVSVESAKWGTFLGVVDGCDHWDLRGGGAPRWAGKSSSNKEHTSGDAPASDRGKDLPKPAAEKKENTWNDINRLIGNLLSANGKKESKSQDSTSAPNRSQQGSFSSDHPGDNQGMIDEVATWISSRLPQGDKERRAEAERAADAGYIIQTPPTASETAQNPNLDIRQSLTPSKQSMSELTAMQTQVKLRREAAWQEELGHDHVARELRRELAWHRAERDRHVSTSAHMADVTLQGSARARPSNRELEWDAHVKQRDGKDSSTNADLELFWIAICRHLWSQGF